MSKVYVFTAFGGPEVQRFADLPVPTAGDGELVIRVRAAGVNPADWKRRANFRRSPDPFPGDTPMGLEVAGVIESAGGGTDGFRVGDRVFGSPSRNGAFAEYSVLPVAQAALIPETVSFADAATLPVASATAYDGIVQLDLHAGETLLITGAGGGVGIAAAQMASNLGVRVLGTASAAKNDLLESIGAVAVTYGEGELDRIRALAPDGVDALYDNIGGATLRALAPLVKDRARLITAADAATATELGGAAVARARNAEVLGIVAGMVADGRLKPFVTEVFPLERVDEALAVVEAGHATGKVVVEVN